MKLSEEIEKRKAQLENRKIDVIAFRLELTRIILDVEQLEKENQELKDLLNKISNSGSWFYSALELDNVDGEELKKEIEQLLSKLNRE